MVWKQTEGYWNEFIGEAKKRWGKLTDNDLVESKGNRDILIGRLQKLYGISSEEAELKVDEMEHRIKDAKHGAEKMYGGDKH